MQHNLNKLLILLIPSIIAASLYGGIAYYVNSDHSVNAGILAALTQGIASFFVTLSSTLLMQWMFSLPKRPALKFFMASAGSGALLFLLFVSVHILMRTPDIFETLLPSLITGTPYFIAIPWFWYKKALELQ